MAVIEVNNATKRSYNNLYEKLGEDTMKSLLKSYKEAEKLKDNIQESQLQSDEYQKEIAALNKTVNDLKSQIKSHETKKEKTMAQATDPAAVTVLTQALESMKQINESYARENERLLKITNFSEYDERIMALNREIGSLKANLEGRGDSLKKANEKISGLENKVREQGDDIRELNTFLEDARAQTENKKAELTDAQDKISSRDESIARQRADIANKEAEIEELKKRFDLLQAEVSTMAVAQNGARSEDQLHG